MENCALLRLHWPEHIQTVLPYYTLGSFPHNGETTLETPIFLLHKITFFFAVKNSAVLDREIPEIPQSSTSLLKSHAWSVDHLSWSLKWFCDIFVGGSSLKEWTVVLSAACSSLLQIFIETSLHRAIYHSISQWTPISQMCILQIAVNHPACSRTVATVASRNWCCFLRSN